MKPRLSTRLRIALQQHLLGKAWIGLRTHIETAVEPGIGGVAFLGDSITHFGKWDLLFPRIPTRNLGIGGERSDHMLARVDPIVALRPEKLFILIGTNDLGVGRDVEDISADVEALAGELRKRLPGCAIYLQGLMPRARKFASRVRNLNDRYRAIADRQGATFIDLFPVFDDGTGQLRATLTPDGLHLNGAGYLAWREAIKSFVEK